MREQAVQNIIHVLRAAEAIYTFRSQPFSQVVPRNLNQCEIPVGQRRNHFVHADAGYKYAVDADVVKQQPEAVKSAELYVCGQGDGTLTIAAFGDVPTCDIPIVVILLH